MYRNTNCIKLYNNLLFLVFIYFTLVNDTCYQSYRTSHNWLADGQKQVNVICVHKIIVHDKGLSKVLYSRLMILKFIKNDKLNCSQTIGIISIVLLSQL